MTSTDLSAVTRRLKYAILADNHHHLKKLCEKRDILPMYHFLKIAYKADSQQKPESILKECRKLNRILLQYQAANQAYQSLDTLSKLPGAGHIMISNDSLIQHFMHALHQYQYVSNNQKSSLGHLKKMIRQLIEDVSISTYQHLLNGRFTTQANRILGHCASSTTAAFKQKLNDSVTFSEQERTNITPKRT